MYFFTDEVSESFKTLGEAKQWILEQRCPDHVELVEEESEEVNQEHCETAEITGNAFEDDTDDDKPLISDSSDSEEDTEQKRNIRLNKMVVLDELKKKPLIHANRRKPKRWQKFK